MKTGMPEDLGSAETFRGKRIFCSGLGRLACSRCGSLRWADTGLAIGWLCGVCRAVPSPQADVRWGLLRRLGDDLAKAMKIRLGQDGPYPAVTDAFVFEDATLLRQRRYAWVAWADLAGGSEAAVSRDLPFADLGKLTREEMMAVAGVFQTELRRVLGVTKS